MTLRNLILTLALVLSTVAAGCMTSQPGAIERADAPLVPTVTFDGRTWPNLTGQKLVILDHGAFGGFKAAKAAFENLTGATVEHVEADDTGSMLERATRERANPSFDVIYGIDNILLTKAIAADVLEPYKPSLSKRINASYVFFDPESPWHATPVDHGYIGVNWNPTAPALGNATLTNLDDVARHADRFVTEDPRTSTPGLGFLLATVATYGDTGNYTYLDYWQDLFKRGVLVTSGWTEAYENHYSGGYGRFYGGKSDRDIVTSYTTSPAYELYYESDIENKALIAPQSTFHQIQTMGIAKGAKHPLAARAWIEFTLTDTFQALAAKHNAIYPVVDGVDVSAIYNGKDPAPGTFQPAEMSPATIGENVERWIRAWVDVAERHNAV